MNILYQTESYGKTAEQVANEFARSYFAEPRSIESFNGAAFTLVDGMATYTITLKPGKRFESVDCYIIVRKDK